MIIKKRRNSKFTVSMALVFPLLWLFQCILIVLVKFKTKHFFSTSALALFA